MVEIDSGLAGQVAGLRPAREALSYKMVEDELALFDKSINEFWNKFKSTVSDTSCQMVGLRDAGSSMTHIPEY